MSYALDNLATERANAGLDIAALAEKSNTSDWIIRKLEVGGTVTNDVAQRIADALGVSLVTLGGREL